MSRACWATPRKMLPPPTTIAICAPSLSASASSSAISCTRCDSRPKPCVPARASPESLRRTRWNAGVGIVGSFAFQFPGFELETRNRKPETSLLFFRFDWVGEGDGCVRIADLEAGETAHADVFTQLADLGGDELRDG